MLILRVSVAILLALMLTACRNSEHYLNSGRQHATAGRWTEAVLDFQKAIQKDPVSAAAHYELGEALLRQGNSRDSLRALGRAAELRGSTPAYRRRLADVALTLYLNDPRHPQALLDRLQKLSDEDLTKDPKSPDGLRVRGFLRLTDGKYDAALTDFRAVLAVRPGDVEISLATAKALLMQSDFAAAEDVLAKALTAHPDASAIYDVLYAHYRSIGKPEAAESLRQRQAVANPSDLDAGLRLAAHYFETRQPDKLSAVLTRLSDAKTFPDGPLAVTRFYSRHADWKAAAAMIESALRDDPSRRNLWQKEQLSLLVAQGKTGEVRSVAEALLKDNPNDVDALSVRGTLLMSSPKPEDLAAAGRDFDAIAALEPKDPVSRFKLGRIAQIRGDRAAARKHYDSSARLRATYLPPRMAIAELLFEQRQLEPALEQLDQILRVDPKNPEVRLLRSAVLMELGRKAIAQSELQQLQQEFPGYPAAALQAGYFALARKAYLEAEGWFRKVYVPGAPDLRALNGLVEIRLGRREPDAAIALLRQDLGRRASSGAPVRELLAATAVRLGRLDDALKEYELLVKDQPDSAAIRTRYAELFRLSGNANEAIVQYRKAMELETKSPGPAAMLGYLLATTQRLPEARTALEKAHALAPQDPEILNNLAFLLAEMKTDLPAAAAHAQTAMRLNPQERRYRDTLGWIYAQSRQIDSALQILRAVAREEPANALYRYHLAFALLEKGERAEARKTLNEALTLKPSKDEDSRIRELLSKAG